MAGDLTDQQPPELMRQFLERTGASARRPPTIVRFRQRGEMQLKPGRWLSFEATQEVAVGHVGFSWRASFPLAPLLAVRVRDWYANGDGGLEARLLGFPVARASGPETARSEAMRYLAELPWFPDAALANDELSWREIGNRSIEVATSVRGVSAAVTFEFDASGDIAGISARNRPRQEGKRFVERPWFGSFSDYRDVGGIRIPAAAEVAWQLPKGPFPYFRGRVFELQLADT